MKHWGSAIAAAVLTTVSGPLHAGNFDDGLAAFRAEDYGTAYMQWRDCALKRSAACQYGLGILHDQGLGARRDATEAVAWFERAAAQDYPDALMELGFLYAIGREGVPQDAVRAWAWFARAAAMGVRNAAAHRDRVAQVLTTGELAAAQRLADRLSIRYHQQQ